MLTTQEWRRTEICCLKLHLMAENCIFLTFQINLRFHLIDCPSVLSMSVHPLQLASIEITQSLLADPILVINLKL